MASADFVHEIAIHVKRARLHAFLCDLRNYVPLHPLIESIEEISRGDESTAARHYRVVDRIPLGPLRLRTVYTAALEPIGEYEVHGHAWQSPGIRLHTVYGLEDIESGTKLSERVSIDAPRMLRRFVVSQARRSHEETLRKLKALLEAAGESRA
jgi:hypothetical protein